MKREPLEKRELLKREIHWESQDVVGQWCVLTYDHDIYPGTILEVNETRVMVKCMHQIGKNRFWPGRKVFIGTHMRTSSD